MQRAYRQTVVIGPEGRGEIPKTELCPGTTAEVVVLFEESVAPEVNREALAERLRAMSDEAISNGMEAWDIDRVNAEIHERRYGDRESY